MSCFETQISEAIEIKMLEKEDSAWSVNNRLEYNRCIFPDIREIADDEGLEAERKEELKEMRHIRLRELEKMKNCTRKKKKQEGDYYENLYSY